MLLLVTTLALYVGLGWVAHGAARARGLPPLRPVLLTLAVALGVTLAALGGALAGVFAVFDTVPPRFALFVLVTTVSVQLVLGRTGALASIPLPRLVALQSFRLLVELSLFELAKQGRIPIAMTFEGRNLDVAVALTAPLVAWMLHRHGDRARPLVLAWNAGSLLMLANVVVIGLTSLPGPSHLRDGVAPVALAQAPWILVPGLFVTSALASHVVVFRRLLARQPIAGGPEFVRRS